MTEIKVPLFAETIVERLEEAGYEAWLVGGCVRDSMLGRTPNDWDITTSAAPDAVMGLFEKTVPTGLKFGTVTVLLDGEKAEVTAMRSESEYDDFRRPSTVTFGTSIKIDLSRRDFTVNAMAYHPKRGLFDPYHGREDIEKKLIRAVGEPEQRFQEDALRILRAFRFAAQLDFSIEKDTFNAAQKKAVLVERVSGERIKSELDKILLSSCPQQAVELVNAGVINYLGFHNMPRAGGLEKVQADLPFRWAAFFYTAKPAQTPGLVMSRLHFDTKTRKTVLWLLDELESDLPRNAYELKTRLSAEKGPQFYRKFLELYSVLTGIDTLVLQETAEAVGRHKEPYCLSMLAIDGSDLISAGVSAGPGCGLILKELLKKTMQDPSINQKDVLLELAKKIKI